jgi:hypothetical protein
MMTRADRQSEGPFAYGKWLIRQRRANHKAFIAGSTAGIAVGVWGLFALLHLAATAGVPAKSREAKDPDSRVTDQPQQADSGQGKAKQQRNTPVANDANPQYLLELDHARTRDYRRIHFTIRSRGHEFKYIRSFFA